VAARPTAGGGRRVEVDPERLPRWLAGFAERHGGYTAHAADPTGTVALRAADGELAELYPPPGAPAPADLDALVRDAARPRRLGLLLVRRGGFAVGVAAGAELTASKVDTRYVQSRTAAGGWSQQRYARRRGNQAKALVEAAAEVAGRLLGAGQATALVAGGDRSLVDAVLAAAGLPAPARLVDVPDPRLAVLQAAVRQARAVHVVLRRPAEQ
jgi:hypothetical protein